VNFAGQLGNLTKAWASGKTDSPVAGWNPRPIRGWIKLFGESAFVIVAKKKKKTLGEAVRVLDFFWRKAIVGVLGFVGTRC
jgi:hypothetical protein